jgi:hypothetical protein
MRGARWCNLIGPHILCESGSPPLHSLFDAVPGAGDRPDISVAANQIAPSHPVSFSRKGRQSNLCGGASLPLPIEETSRSGGGIANHHSPPRGRKEYLIDQSPAANLPLRSRCVCVRGPTGGAKRVPVRYRYGHLRDLRGGGGGSRQRSVRYRREHCND